MYTWVKTVWIFFAVFSLFAFLSSLPYESWQKSYLDARTRINKEPQKRVDATFEYVEKVEDNKIDTSKGVNFEGYYRLKKLLSRKIPAKKSTRAPEKKYDKPFYIRDKNNPNILYPNNN